MLVTTLGCNWPKDMVSNQTATLFLHQLIRKRRISAMWPMYDLSVQLKKWICRIFPGPRQRIWITIEQERHLCVPQRWLFRWRFKQKRFRRVQGPNWSIYIRRSVDERETSWDRQRNIDRRPVLRLFPGWQKARVRQVYIPGWVYLWRLIQR